MALFVAILKWCLAHWKWFVGAAAVLVAWWAVAVVLDWRSDSKALPAVKEEVRQEKKKREEDRKEMTESWNKAQIASEGYQRELAAIRDTPHPPAPVIRVCRSVTMPRPAASPSADTGGPSPAAATAGVLQEPLEFDTSPLYDDADRADGLSAQVRGLLAVCGGGGG